QRIQIADAPDPEPLERRASRSGKAQRFGRIIGECCAGVARRDPRRGRAAEARRGPGGPDRIRDPGASAIWMR
ncbi:MAG: hypothetical protein ACKOEE_14025, partial [Tagaea sp.]